MSIQAISNQSFAVSLGTEEVKIWSQIRMEEAGEAKMVWSVVSALKFRDMKVKQLVPNIRLRLKNISQQMKGKPTLAVLHENGWVSFWS